MANDGGPAFPQVQALARCTIYDGMSLLDYFAGQALVALGNAIPRETGSTLGIVPEPERIKELRAEWAYAQAAAMLKARESILSK